jgi:hypothetical protein
MKVLDEAEGRLGLEQTVDGVLVPALRELGLRWELGVIDVAIEHLTTTAARRWIARRHGNADEAAATPVLLAAAPGNEHTVALEAFGMLLEARGVSTLHLGANCPVPAVVAAAKRTNACAAVVTAQQVSRRQGAVTLLRCLKQQTPTALYFAGAAFDGSKHRRSVPGTYLGQSLAEATVKLEADMRDQQDRNAD